MARPLSLTLPSAPNFHDSQLDIAPYFTWRDRSHGASLRFMVWVEDDAGEHIYHSESFTLTKVRLVLI